MSQVESSDVVVGVAVVVVGVAVVVVGVAVVVVGVAVVVAGVAVVVAGVAVVVVGAESGPLPHAEATNRNVRAIACFLTVGLCHPPEGCGDIEIPMSAAGTTGFNPPHGSDALGVYRHGKSSRTGGTPPGASHQNRTTPNRTGG